MAYEIKKGIPLPDGTRNKSHPLRPLDQMAVGDAIEEPRRGDEPSTTTYFRAYNACHYRNNLSKSRKDGKRFKAGVVEGKVYIWRIE